MTPPPIRYPLPTLALVALLGVLAWWGRGWIVAVGAAVRSGIDRVASGPPVPSSTEPKRLAGPIVRKVLLLRDGVSAADLPDGSPVETIGRRIFADVYDVWPLRGEPTHYRIGNRRPIGWVPAADVLPWDTRLVVRVAGGTATLRDDPGAEGGASVAVGASPLPLLGWQGEALRVAIWEPGEPWSRVDRTGWIRAEEAGEGAIRVLLSRFELLELLRRSIDPAPGSGRSLRVLAAIGQLGIGGPLDAEQVEEALDALPAPVSDVESAGGESVADRLGRLNDSWRADAAWSGIEYRVVPLELLP